MPVTPEGKQPPKRVVKTTYIPGDFTGKGNIISGSGNKDGQGRPLKSSPLPAGSTITEGEEVIVEGKGLSLADKIKADVQAKLRAAGISEDQDQGGITIGGKTDKKSVVLAGDNMTVDTSKKPTAGQIPLGTERTLPFRSGSSIGGGSNVMGQVFDGEWTLISGGNGKFVYRKTK